MNGHPQLLLDAYLDGELDPRLQKDVERHLESCAECRARVAGRRALAGLLQSAPPAQPVRTEQRFAAEVALRLERRAPWGERASFSLEWLAWSVPLALALLWAVNLSVMIVGGAAELAPGLPEWLAARSAPLAAGVVPPELGEAADVLIAAGPAGWDPLLGWILPAAVSLVYLGWMAAWWLTRDQAAAGRQAEKGA